MAIDNLAAERGPDALPPHNADAEEAVLGASLIDSQAVAQVASFLRPADFFRDAARHRLRRHARTLRPPRAGRFLTLQTSFSARVATTRSAAWSSCPSLLNVVPTSLHVEQYGADRRARRAAAPADRRRGAHRGPRLRRERWIPSRRSSRPSRCCSASPRSAPSARLPEAGRRAARLLGAAPTSPPTWTARSSGIPTGFKDLDKLLGGLQRSDLIILAARPSMGKSSFALCLARNAAVRVRRHGGHLQPRDVAAAARPAPAVQRIGRRLQPPAPGATSAPPSAASWPTHSARSVRRRSTSTTRRTSPSASCAPRRAGCTTSSGASTCSSSTTCSSSRAAGARTASARSARSRARSRRSPAS